MTTGGRTLEERVERLEAEIWTHQRELELLRSGRAPGPEPDGAGETTGDRGPRAVPGLPRGLAGMRRWEWWLNKVGVALFLMGVVFLFKFSWDRGWLQGLLTPPVRVGLGLFLGSALVWTGLRVYERRRAFAQVVLGGGVGAYYITAFAAYRMLDVIGHPVAFAFMVAVTLLAFVLALGQDGAALAVIGVSGGFATPFLLHDGGGSVFGLVFYLCVVLAGASGAYLYKGWSQLLLVASAGYWAALLAGYAGAGPSGADLAVLQAGVLFGWASLWLVPVAREVLRPASPDRRPVGEPGPFARARISEGGTPACLSSFVAPAVGLLLTQLLWDPGRTGMGVLIVGVAAAHGLGWACLRRAADGGPVAYAQALVALLLSTLAMAFLLEGGALLLVLTAEAAALHLAAGRLPDRNLAAIAHALTVLVAAWLFGRLVGFVAAGPASDPAVVGFGALSDLLVLALILAASRFVSSTPNVAAYRLAAHAGLLGWYCRELTLLPGASDAYVTLAWGLTGAGMLVAGLRTDRAYPIRGGLVTLLLAVAKLLLWDLANLDPAWRVLLFLGFGVLFLVLGYHLRNLWNPRPPSPGPVGDAGG